MINSLRQIKKLALEMRDHTSINDSDHALLQKQSDLCDYVISHFIDDGN